MKHFYTSPLLINKTILSLSEHEEAGTRITALVTKLFALADTLPDIVKRPKSFFFGRKSEWSYFQDVWGIKVNGEDTGLFFVHDFEKIGSFTVPGEFVLKIHMHSDLPTQIQYQEMIKDRVKEAGFASTEYILNEGKITKIIQLPIQIKTDRVSLIEHTKQKVISVYLSELTKEDITCIEEALRKLHDMVSKYLKTGEDK